MKCTAYDPILPPISGTSEEAYDYEEECEAGSEAREEWFVDRLRSSTLSDDKGRSRTLIGDPEAHGTAGDGYDYAHFDEDFCHDRMYTHVLRYNPPDEGPELMESKRQHALNATEAYSYTYTPSKWKMIHPSRMEKTHRLACTESAEKNVYDDGRTTHYVDYDRFRIALEQRSTVHEQQEATGIAGKLISPIVRFYETQAPIEGASDKLTQMKGHLIPAEAIPYPELAAYLLTRPTNLLRQFYRKDRAVGLHLMEDLEKIAILSSEEDMTERERRVMTTLIRKHLDDMEVNRIFDPIMIHYVQQTDARHIEVNAMRDTYDRVHRIVCGESNDESSSGTIIFPLAVHMYERNIPVTIENVIGEMEVIDQTREIIDRLRTDFGRQLEDGGPQDYLDHASEEEKAILDSVGRNVVAVMMPSGNCRTTRFLPIIGEEEREDADLVAGTMFGPRQRGGIHSRADYSSGGYYQPGGRTIDPPEQEVAPFDRPTRRSPPVYSPYTEAHEFLRRTRLRKFIVPSY